MKIAFIIDKTQTFQIIAKVLKEALKRKHKCYVYCCFKRSQLENLGNYYEEYKENLCWFNNNDRNVVVNKLINDRSNYDAVIGTNFFNKSLRSVYGNQEKTNYGLEYCWNEIYNCKDAESKNFKSEGTLFCNSEITKNLVKQIINFKNLECIGSPWYEFLDEMKTHTKTNKIVLMAPHQSFYSQIPNLKGYVISLISALKVYCQKRNLDLVLKTRSKYSVNYDIPGISHLVSDNSLCNHIETYRDAQLVINFCSSAIAELSYLRVPFLVIGSDFQKNLHNGTQYSEGIKLIHEKYYSGEIFDKFHSDSLQISNYIDYNNLECQIDNLINSKKDWENFQKKFFCNMHKGSSIRVVKRIERDGIEKNTANV